MDESVKNCIEQAERFLVLREHNKNELIDKLKNKNYELETIEKSIKILIEMDELNENRYIKTFIKSSNRKHPEGKFMVFNRLLAKKADKELSRQILDEIYTEEYTFELIKEAVKLIDKKGKTDGIFQKKQELLKRGFPSSEIRQFFDKIQ